MSTEFKEFSAKKTQADVFDILISTEKIKPRSKTGARHGLVLPGNMDKKKKSIISRKLAFAAKN